MNSNIQQSDKALIWHPFTPQLNAEPNIPLVKAVGALLFDENGKAYIDAISSWWVNLHGHSHPHIAAAIAAQANELEHVLFSGYTHRPAVKLAELLLERLPYMSKVFYSDDGSTAVEVALKMAFQYWHNLDRPKRKVIAFENAYHGDTFGSMSVGARNVFSAAFEKHLFEVAFIPLPVKGCEEASRLAMEAVLQSDDVAAFIFEPLIQGAGGMNVYDAAQLDKLISMCRAKNVICIADEVMTGFGRTGNFFATDYCNEQPDIICLSKGITGGFMPLGATICRKFIHDAYLTSDRTKTFFHGHSYTGNPLACAAGVASMELMQKEQTFAAINRIAERFQEFAFKNRLHTAVKSVRYLGAILAIEFKSQEETGYLNKVADHVHRFFIERGIVLRPLGNVVYVIPPYCTTDEQLSTVFVALEDFMEFMIHSSHAE
ncbi:MAG: adenosylmethionine--8-amino-7-oxononanoate transaminase [Bacteroidia bacterium]